MTEFESNRVGAASRPRNTAPKAKRPTWLIACAGLGVALICFVLAQLMFGLGSGSSDVVFSTLGYVFFVGMLAGIVVALCSPLISARLNADSTTALPNHLMARPGTTNTLAILSIIFAFMFPLLGVIFGHVARSQIRRSGEKGDGLALAGLIVGYLSMAAVAVLMLVVFSQ